MIELWLRAHRKIGFGGTPEACVFRLWEWFSLHILGANLMVDSYGIGSIIKRVLY